MVIKVTFGQNLNGPIDPHRTVYGYLVDQRTCIAFLVVFTITFVIHVAQSVKYRVWWLVPTLALCALGEIIGWAGRLWSTKQWYILDAYLMQTCCTIFSPSFLAAGLFFILGAIINRLGPHYSTLSPRTFSVIFLSGDTVALIIQAIGGSSASKALTSHVGDPETGAKIMVGGIIFQIVVVTLYVLTAVDFLVRWAYDKPMRRKADIDIESTTFGAPSRGHMDKNMKLMLLGMVLATLFLYVRSIYRTIELLNGWTGKIITNQNLFDYLDGLQIVLALFTLNIFNPGRLLFNQKGDKDNLSRSSPSTPLAEKERSWP